MHIKKLSTLVFCFIVFVISHFISNQGTVLFDALTWIAAMVIAGVALGIFIPRSAHIYLLSIVLVWLAIGVGITEISTVLLWLISAWCLGSLVLRNFYTDKFNLNTSAIEAVVFGGATWLAIWGGMLHFAINYRWLYLALCLIPCLLVITRISIINVNLRVKINLTQEWIREIPLWFWITGLTIIGWVLRWSSFPSMGYDENAQHLRIWTEILANQQYAFDIHTQIWSVAPFTISLLHAGLSLMAGEDTRGAMNLVIAILILFLMIRIMSYGALSRMAQWLLIVLMVSTPMLGNLLLTLQTELVLALLVLVSINLVININGGWRGQHVIGVLSCVALCIGIKLPGVVLGFTLMLVATICWWTPRAQQIGKENLLRWPALLGLIPLAFVAFHSYGLAWNVTGNPVFPLYNAIFLSPYFPPENFKDTLYVKGFSFTSYVRVFFNTSEYFESGNFTAGWQYLLLLPLAILLSLRKGTPKYLRVLLIPLLGFGLVMFSAMQYWRYLFPVMPIAGVFLAILFINKNKKFKVAIAIVAIICIVLNLIFFPKVSWMMKSSANTAYMNDGKKTLTRLYAPVALLTERINQITPGARVLYPLNFPYGAKLNGSPLYVNWYAPSRALHFSSLKNGNDVREFLIKERVDFVILNISDTNAAASPESSLRAYLAEFGSVVAQEGSFLLYRLSDTPMLYRKVFDLDSAAKNTLKDVELLLPVSRDGVVATSKANLLAITNVYRAKQARYSVNISCPTESGYFVAQVNWDKGPPYYHLIACKPQKLSFVETVPIPIGANKGFIYITTRDTNSIQIEKLILEVH